MRRLGLALVLALVMAVGVFSSAAAQGEDPTPTPVPVTVVVPTPEPLSPDANNLNGPEPYLVRYYALVFFVFGITYLMVRIFDQHQFTFLWMALCLGMALMMRSNAGAGVVYTFYLASLVTMGVVDGLQGLFK